MEKPSYAHPLPAALKRGGFWLLVLVLFVNSLGRTSGQALAATSRDDSSGTHLGSYLDGDTPSDPLAPDAQTGKQTYHVYMPFGLGNYRSPINKAPVLLGTYPDSWWKPNPQGTVDKDFRPLDDWEGKRMSLAGVFHRLDDPNVDGNVTYLLSMIWDNGYTPFVNLYVDATSYDVARGALDAKIKAWARAYAAFANGGQRMAFLAPLQEMNGEWVPYGMDPTNFKLAYKHIQDLFRKEGVPDQSMRWVFAPNGYSARGDPPFESYYPGDSLVDVVALSAYNFGYHPKNSYPDWETPQEVFGDYLDRARAMAPNKPIFIAQTGTTAYTKSGWDGNAKNQWLRDAYTYLAAEPNVQAVIYYNADMQYDWAFYKEGAIEFKGYSEAVSDPIFTYISPSELKKSDLLTVR